MPAKWNRQDVCRWACVTLGEGTMFGLHRSSAARLLAARFKKPRTLSGPAAREVNVTLSGLGLAGGAVALEADLAGASGVIVDLTAEAAERTELVARLRPPGLPVLAFYAHVEADVRRGAEAAGFELVVPRSRMAREGAALVARLLASGAPAGSP